MTALFAWFLASILGPLMLPVFALALLCTIAGARPEPIISAFLGIFTTAIELLFRLFAMILSAVLNVPMPSTRKTYPRKYPPTRKSPKAPKSGNSDDPELNTKNPSE